jgi:hypothetical protein
LNALARKARGEPAEHLLVRVQVPAQVLLWVRVVFDGPCIQRASILPERPEHVRECPGGPDSALRAQELEAHLGPPHPRQVQQTVHRADMPSVAAATSVTRSPKKVR